jgi:hypothetical protein
MSVDGQVSIDKRSGSEIPDGNRVSQLGFVSKEQLYKEQSYDDSYMDTSTSMDISYSTSVVNNAENEQYEQNMDSKQQ